MEVVLKKFPNGLPTLEQIRKYNKGSDVPLETAWIWGEDDEIGRINLLTPARVLAAKTNELRDGHVVSLNWPMNLPKKPAFGRAAAKHTLKPNPEGLTAFDDLLDINTQSGSQWDGFRHFGHLSHQRFYNNLTKEEALSGTRCGIQAVSNHGIVGRGVLLDYYSWKLDRGEPYDPFTAHAIPLDELLEVSKAQNVKFEVGDILLVRSGFIDAYHRYEKTDPQRLEEVAGARNPRVVGVARTEEMKTWLHDSYFSAVAGDAAAWEVWPPKQWALHEYLLGLWGVPIGEMFDLEALAKQCKEKKRWSFFFMSTPINMPGGVASLANALAVH